jgi:tetratricopeptide (TPR) repeat protein
MSAQAEAARSLIRVGRHGDAISLLQQALASMPDDEELHCLLAQAYLGAEEPDDALRAADDAVELAPDEEWPHRLRSVALGHLGRHDEAVEAATEAVRLAPEQVMGRTSLAEALLEANRVDKAYVQAYEARRLSPDDSDVYDLLGRCMIGRGMYREAEASFRYALQLDPNDAAAHNNLGVVLQRQGRREEAVNAFNDAARIDPSFETARENLYAGTRFLIGGGWAAFLAWLMVRLAVVGGVIIAIPIAVVWIWTHRPFAQKKLPPTAIAYYKAERKRLLRIVRPYVLLRLTTIPIVVGMLVVGGTADSFPLVLLSIPVGIAWYWVTPRLWRRYVRRIA